MPVTAECFIKQWIVICLFFFKLCSPFKIRKNTCNDVFLIKVFNLSVQQIERLAGSRGFQSRLCQRSDFSFADLPSLSVDGVGSVEKFYWLCRFQILDIKGMGAGSWETSL